MNNPAGPSGAEECSLDNEAALGSSRGYPVNKKSGTSNKGLDYEKYMLLWVLLGLLEDPDIQEFYVADNVDGVGAFDDIVIRVKRKVPGKKEPVRELICVQLKHKENTEKKITWQEVIGKSNGPYKMQKYFNEYNTSKLKSIGKFGDPILDECHEEDITVVLYTNASFEFEVNPYNGNSYCRKLLVSKNTSTVFDFNESMNNNKLWAELAKKYNNEEIQNFLKKFIVFSKQCDIELIKTKLITKLRRYIPSENVFLGHALQRAVEFTAQNNSMWLSRDSGALCDISIIFQGVPVKLIDVADIFDKPYFKEEQSINREERQSQKYQFMNKVIVQHMGLDNENRYVCVGHPLKYSEQYYVDRNPVMEYRDCRYELYYSQVENKLVTSWPYARQPLELVFDASLLLICAGPGMGKSSYFTHQAVLLKISTPLKFVIRVNLIDFSEYLRDLDINADYRITADNFLLHISGVAPGTAEHDLFQACLRSREMMIVFLDGVDEVSPDYYGKLVAIVQTIHREYNLQLWISTRPVVRDRMEIDLKTQSWILEEFSYTEAEKFIDVYSPTGKQIFKAIDVTVSLTRIPIFCRLLGDIINKGSKASVQNLTNEIDLYDAFVDVMYDVYNQEKKRSDVSLSAINRDIEKLKKIVMEDHEKAAVLELFNARQLSELSWNIRDECEDFLEDISEGQEKAGLIVNIVKGQPRFIHRTVAEYFCGRWFSKNHDKYHQYVEKYNRFPVQLDLFMSYKLNKTHELFRLILLKKYDEISNYLNDFDGELNIRDSLGRDALYYVNKFAVDYYKNDNFKNDSFEIKKSMYNTLGKFMTEDMVQNLTDVSEPVRCLVNLNLLSAFFDGLDPTHRPVMVHILTCVLCETQYNNMYCVHVFLLNYCKSLPLHVSILDIRNSEELTLMSEENINLKDDIGLTPLHLAVLMHKAGVVKLLRDRGARDSNDNVLGLYPDHLTNDTFTRSYDFHKHLKTLPEDKKTIFGKHIRNIVIEIIKNDFFTKEVENSYTHST